MSVPAATIGSTEIQGSIAVDDTTPISVSFYNFTPGAQRVVDAVTVEVPDTGDVDEEAGAAYAIVRTLAESKGWVIKFTGCIWLIGG